MERRQFHTTHGTSRHRGGGLINITSISAATVARGSREVEVTQCPNGPLLVRGADLVRDESGQAHPVTRPVVAVCVCDKSQRLPWCDGTHKVIPVNEEPNG